MRNRASSLPSHWTETPLVRVLGPFQKFLHSTTSGGIVLIIATVVALMLANSPLAETYDELLHTYIGISIGTFEFSETVLHWINDGLMAIFFLLVGLEIKREVLVGELSNRRAAMLPIAAAFGGAVIPALIYSALNSSGDGTSGWGIPMATDIAFSLGVLALLGNRIPLGLKVFLTAVAIVDDLIAIVVIAVFYSGGIDFLMLGIGLAAVGVLFGANLLGIRSLWIYMIVGVCIWFAFFESGVHATIAGVLVALTIPARNRIDVPTFAKKARYLIGRLENNEGQPTTRMLTDDLHQAVVHELEEISEDVQAPLQKLEHSLHNVVAFVIMPVFALANAGVALRLDALGGDTLNITLGIILGLVIGKPVGLFIASWLITRAGMATLPTGVRWTHILGASCLAGIGFTMSLFVASLAFDDTLLDPAKIGILVASLLAAVLGAALLWRVKAVQVITAVRAVGD